MVDQLNAFASEVSRVARACSTGRNHDMEVLTAANGRQASDLIEATPDLGVVLMDIMMPEMDG